MPRTPDPRRRSPRTRRLARVAATALVVAVVGTGGVVLAPAPAAHAAWQPSTTSWISGLDAALGSAGRLFSFETGPVDILASLAGPLISSIFGLGDEGPSIDDVLDKLKELDDIEYKLDQMQKNLDEIEAAINRTDVDVLMGTCNLQASQLDPYIADLTIAQQTYANVIRKIEAIRQPGGDQNQKKDDLKKAVNTFVSNALGSESGTSVLTSPLNRRLTQVHVSMVSTNGGAGIIQSCGRAFYAQWKNDNASKAGLMAATPDDPGAWLDDRQYYEKLQTVVQYWQTASAQGAFLLQQATIMQATKMYVSGDHPKTLEPEDATNVCAIAQTTSGSSAGTRQLCEEGLQSATAFYSNLAGEWRQVGLPYSDDSIVMSLGSDVTGVAGADGKPVASTLWARTPSTFPASWTTGTWGLQGAAATTVDGIPGFSPANSAEWQDLSSSYQADHPTIPFPAQIQGQLWQASTQGNRQAITGTRPFAPVDILARMRSSLAPTAESPDGTPQKAFDLTGVGSVWMPGETGTFTFPNSRSPQYKFGPETGLSITPARYINDGIGFYDDSGLSIKCFVAPVDGVLCDSDTVGSWWNTHQAASWTTDDTPTTNPSNQLFQIVPSDPDMGGLVIDSDAYWRCNTRFTDDDYLPYSTECGSRITYIPGLPAWLAPVTAKSGVNYEGDPTATKTLWPATRLPTDCKPTVWGAPTRCGAAMESWLKATIPNPSLSGPVATAPLTVGVGADAQHATCAVPPWNADPLEAGVAVQTSDATWTGFRPDGDSYTVTAPIASELDLNDFARKAGWYRDGSTTNTPHFTVRCSFTAKFADLASLTTVQSAVRQATLAGTQYSLASPTSAGAEPGAEPGAAVPAADIAPPGADGRASLAATGIDAAPWLGAAALLALLGGAFTLLGRRRRRV